MHYAFGISRQECMGVRREGNTIILRIETPSSKLSCSCCGSASVVCSGGVRRRFRSVPCGCMACELEMHVRRLKCKECGACQQEEIDFSKGKRRHTNAFATLVIDMSRFATISDIAWFLGVSWDMVRNIQMEYLQAFYGSPDLSGLRMIAIDEFASHKGQTYKTIVIDMETGHIVYVGEGNGKDALEGFWEKLGDGKDRIRAVCTDMSAAYTNAVVEHLPDASLVIDHFHVIKLMNEHIDNIRRNLVHTEKDLNKRKVIKGTRWLLLKNGKDIFDDKYRTRLDNALSLNEPLMKAYYLKEDLREIWNQSNRRDAENVLDTWVQQARDSRIKQLIRMANTIKAYKPYILAWYDYPISNGKIEGIINKIKVLKRQIYGFTNEQFFNLKLYALHDKHIRI